jgi:hypothetical protein
VTWRRRPARSVCGCGSRESGRCFERLDFFEINQLDAHFTKSEALSEINKQEVLLFAGCHYEKYVTPLLVWYPGCGSSVTPMTPRRGMGRLKGRARVRTRMTLRPMPGPTLNKYC